MLGYCNHHSKSFSICYNNFKIAVNVCFISLDKNKEF